MSWEKNKGHPLSVSMFEFQHLDKKTEIFRFPDHLQHTEFREIMLKNVKYLDLALFWRSKLNVFYTSKNWTSDVFFSEKHNLSAKIWVVIEQFPIFYCNAMLSEILKLICVIVETILPPVHSFSGNCAAYENDFFLFLFPSRHICVGHYFWGFFSHPVIRFEMPTLTF